MNFWRSGGFPVDHYESSGFVSMRQNAKCFPGPARIDEAKRKTVSLGTRILLLSYRIESMENRLPKLVKLSCSWILVPGRQNFISVMWRCHSFFSLRDAICCLNYV